MYDTLVLRDTVTDLITIGNDIDHVNTTAKSWGLHMNANKCAVLRFQHGHKIDWNSLWAFSSYFLDNEPIKFVDSHKDLGVTIDNTLKFHLHIQLIVQRAAGVMSNILRSTLCRSQNFMIPIYKTYIRPLIEFSSCAWSTGYVVDQNILEGIQRRWTSNIDGMRDLSYRERLERLDLYSVKGRLIRADLIKCWHIFHGNCAIKPEDIFTLAPQVGTRGHSLKLSPTHVSLECRKRFFSERCVHVWNGLPRDIVEATSVNLFKNQLHTHCKDILFDF